MTSIVLTADQIAQVVAENFPGTPVPITPPVTPKPARVSTASDGTKLVYGTTLDTLEGDTHSVSINGQQTAIFAFVVPGVKPSGAAIVNGDQDKLTHFQTLDTTNATPRTAYISRTPGDLSGQWMFGVGGVATLTCVVDGGDTVVVGKGGTITPHMKVGDTWFLMFQNKDAKGKDSSGGVARNVSLKAQPGS